MFIEIKRNGIYFTKQAKGTWTLREMHEYMPLIEVKDSKVITMAVTRRIKLRKD